MLISVKYVLLACLMILCNAFTVINTSINYFPPYAYDCLAYCFAAPLLQMQLFFQELM